MIDEKKIAGASYVLNFFKDVYYLTHFGTIYMNILLELDNKYPDPESQKSISDQEKNFMLANMQNARYFAKTAFYQYLTIKKKFGDIKEADHNAIVECMEELNERFIISKITIDRMIQELNHVLINDMIQNVLETNQELINIMLGAGQSEKTQAPTATN